MKIYIAGKIAGDRRYRAKFREAAKALEAADHVVLNPATLPDGLTDADYMRICRDKDGNITEQSTARWDADPAGGSVAIWPMDPEKMEPSGPAEVYGDWDAAAYLCRVVELIHPNRQINIPNLEAMIRAAAKDGVDICTYCPDYNCRGCIVNEWKEDPDDE